MARPQSPELRRSGTIPAFEPNSIASRLEAHTRPTSSGESGPVPEENTPGHHPDNDQDQPDPDAFAARFSGRDLDDLPTDTGVLRDTNRVAGSDHAAARHLLLHRSAPIVGVAALAAALAFGVRRHVRRQQRRRRRVGSAPTRGRPRG